MAASGLIPESVIAEIRDRTDIIQVIGQHVQLRRAGANFKGLCPFHDEKTPSFNVSAEKRFFHCFGCQESGDVFTFLMKVEGRRFQEVVEDLAARAGVEIPRVTPAEERRAARQRSDRQLALDLNRRVAELYRGLLLGEGGAAARAYLTERGIGPEQAERFQLGFAPPSGSPVARFLEGEGVSLDLAERLGLVVRRRAGSGAGTGSYHDRFWHRLIFPVVGAGSEVLGFGGRLLGEGTGPKYINSPETMLYHKGEVLYGLAPALGALRRGGVALVVEGNVDVIQLHQHGFEHAVAPMGTALTSRQVHLLRRFAGKVIALFDGDPAGNAAAIKAVAPLIEGGVEAKIASLPKGHDPDTFLRQEGAEAMATVLGAALPVVDFLIETRLREMEDTLPARARLLEEVAPLLARLPSPVDQDLYLSQLALALRVDAGVIRRAMAGHRVAPEIFSRQKAAKGADPFPRAELFLLGVLFEHPHLFPRAEAGGTSSLLTNDALRVTYRAAMEMQRATGRVEPAPLLQSSPEEARNALAQIFQSEAFLSEGDPTRALDDCLSALQRTSLGSELQAIRNEIARARARGDTESMRTLAVRQVELERKIHETRKS